jgi:hypothetical protein
MKKNHPIRRLNIMTIISKWFFTIGLGLILILIILWLIFPNIQIQLANESLQAVIVASTALIGFAGFILFSDNANIRNNGNIKKVKNASISSVLFGFIAIAVSLIWYITSSKDILYVFLPKFAFTAFIGQVLFIMFSFGLRFPSFEEIALADNKEFTLENRKINAKSTSVSLGTENATPTQSEPTQEEYRVYLEERKSLLNAILDQSRSFDKYIITLASGAFGLSLLFIRQLIPEPIPNTVYLLIDSWISYGASILITLLSFLFSQSACHKQISILEQNWFGNLRSKNVNNFYTTITVWANWISMLFFIAGVGLLITFATNNLLN